MVSKITVNEAGCWHWKGARNSRGYGQVGVNKVSKSTHRVAYELLVGVIPEGLVIDHLCRNRACCNPEHLEPVTGRVNSQRGEAATKTHCIRGHELAGDNLVEKLTKRGTIMRNCRECNKVSHKRANDKLRAKQRAARLAESS